MSTISAVSNSGSSNAWAALNTQRKQQHEAKMFAKVDADGSGAVNQTELSSMLGDISAKTGTSLGDSKALFTKMDSNSDGGLSSDELAKGMKALMPAPSTMDFAQSKGAQGADGSSAPQDGPPPAGSGPGGPPPAGGPGAAGATAGASSSSSTTFDPLDINQDGTVSEVERLTGALKDLAKTTQTDSSGNSSTSEVAKLAQKLYEQISSSVLSDSSSSQLSATA